MAKATVKMDYSINCPKEIFVNIWEIFANYILIFKTSWTTKCPICRQNHMSKGDYFQCIAKSTKSESTNVF